MTDSSLPAVAAHLLADFPLQSDRMATEKFECPSVRARHVLVHAVVTAAFVGLARGFDRRLAAFVAAVAMTHYGIDSRRWASGGGFDAYPIAVDQALHATALAAANEVVYGE